MTITISVGLQSTPQSEHKRVKVTADSSIIGRSKECDLTINHPSLSRRHCKITGRKDGWWIQDLGSRGGCKINGLIIDEPYRLDAHTQIVCGEVVVTIINNPLAAEAGGDLATSKTKSHSERQRKRNAVLPRNSSSLLATPTPVQTDSGTSGRRKKIIRPQQNDPVEEHGKLSTAELMVGDLNYDTKELKVKTDFYDLSELQDDT